MRKLLTLPALALVLSALACSSLQAADAPVSAAPSTSAGKPSPPRSTPYAVGWTRLKPTDPSRQRPVWIDVWYPAAKGTRETPRRYSLSMGSVALNAPIAEQGAPHPVLIMSHGSGGAADQYSWLTEALAAQGYVVASVHHWGESRVYGRTDRLAMFRLEDRVLDLSFALSAALAHDAFRGKLNEAAIGAMGHSAGGFSVVALTGASFNVMALDEYCASAVNDHGCQMAAKLSDADRRALMPSSANPSHPDPRVSALLLLDPGLGPSFSAEQLSKISIPVLIVATKPGDFLPAQAHAEYFALNIPGAQVLWLDEGEGHFVFLDPCQLKILVEGIPLCRDAAGVDRRAVHRRLAGEIIRFFNASLGQATPTPVSR